MDRECSLLIDNQPEILQVVYDFAGALVGTYFSRWVRIMGGTDVAVMALLAAWGIMAVAVEGRELWTPRMAPPLFVFGASYMDVGENSAAIPFREYSESEPYGMDFFDGKPSGRYSNGRVITDHISQGLGQEFLSPYLRDVGTTFRHGVNFASAGATAHNFSCVFDGSDGSYSAGHFSLSVQVDQFRVFHKHSLAMHQLKLDAAVRVPSPEDFSRGVYIVEIGNNDYRYDRIDQINDEAFISSVLEHIEHAVRTLYLDGARTVVVMDAFPKGCYPDQLWNVSVPEELSEDGCLISVMKVIETHNAGLQVTVAKLNAELTGANVIIFSLYDVFMSAIRNPSKYGLKYVHKACCGYGGGDFNHNKAVSCGKAGIVDGQLRKATVCENRSEYMMWDGMHPTDAFTFHVAQAFLNGQHMQPPFYIKEIPQLPNFL